MPARRSTTVAVLAAAVLSGVGLAAVPAHAHGALGAPVSRALECGPLGGTAAKSAACRAADAANGGTPAFADWDNLRVPNVNGQDRQKIPDGKLCSAGLPGFRGLDLARADWPTTTLTAGTPFTFLYRVTIPHRGSFRLYVTRDGYSPGQALRWADLEPAPFATVADPPIRNGSYVFTATLPATKSGRHLIYTIWQTTSTVDTYYSCSDVEFTAAPAAAQALPVTTAPTATASQSTASPTTAAPPLARTAQRTSTALPLAATTGAVVLIGGTLLLLLLRRRAGRRARARAGGRR